MTCPETATPDPEGPPKYTPATEMQRIRLFDRRERLRQFWPILIVVTLTLANGLLSLLHGFIFRFSANPRFLALSLPFGLYHWSRLLSVIFGFLLVYLSFHLYQRRRTAWWLASLSLVLAAVLRVGRGHHLYLASGSVAAILLLFVFRRRFTVKSEPRSIAQGARLMAASMVIAIVYGTLGFYLLDRRDFGIDFEIPESIVRTLRAYLLIGNGDLVAHTRHARWFLDSLSVMGTTAVLFAVYSLFRPIGFRLRVLPQERALADALLQKHGRTPEHYWTLWPDKSYFFTRDGDGFIAYRVASGVAVCLSDPVAADATVPALLRDFIAYCSDNGWSASFLYVLPQGLSLYSSAGLRSLKIGTVAVVDLERFCTETCMNKQFRKVKRRLEEDGFSTARHSPPHPPELMRQLEEVSDEWLSLPGRRERSFALGAFERDYASRTPFFVVQDRERRVVAFANEVPAFRPGLATIDMMRHRVGVPNGIMDYLFTELFCRLREQGYRQFDLGLAPLAGVGEGPDRTTEERVVRQVFELLKRFYPFEGLRAYKAKFDPEWEERYMVYRGGAPGLVKTALALARILA